MKPLVSIIIPVYNTGISAAKLVQKVLNDKYTNTEIIVIDDGSNDDSFSKLQTINHPKVKLYRQKNCGASAARNYGIRKTSGKYIIFLDSDDDISGDFISSLVSSIQKPGIELAATGICFRWLKRHKTTNAYITKIKRCQKESIKDFVLRSLFVDGRLYSSVNKIFNANIIKKNHIEFDPKRNFAEDTKFVLDYISVLGNNDIDFILKPLYIYNYGTATSTVANSGSDWNNWERSYQDLKKFIGDSPTIYECFLLKAIRARWRLSYFRSINNSR